MKVSEVSTGFLLLPESQITTAEAEVTELYWTDYDSVARLKIVIVHICGITARQFFTFVHFCEITARQYLTVYYLKGNMYNNCTLYRVLIKWTTENIENERNRLFFGN